MNMPEWTAPSLYGAAVGAIALAIVGFNWGGWVTGGTAQKQSDSASAAAIASIMTPIASQSKSDPKSVEILAELKAAPAYSRRGVIEKAGWATPLGAEKPNSDLAKACELALAAA